MASSAVRQVARIVTPDPIPARARQLHVVDTDFHINPDFSRLAPYLREPFRSKLSGYPLGGAYYDARYAIGLNDTGLTVLGRAETAEDVLQTLDRIGVETVIVSPGLRPVMYFNEPFSSALASAYNDYLANEVLPVSDRIRAFIAINQRDPEDAAREVRRCAVHPGFVGVYAEFGPTEPLGTARHDAMFEALAERELPLALHGSAFWPQGSPWASGARTWVELLGVAWPAAAMANMASMILQGLFDKFTGLRVLIQEAGLWWVIDFMLRMDELYLDHPGDVQLVERKLASGEKYLRRLPSEYVVENFRFSTQPVAKPARAEHLASLLEQAHAERLFLYSSDWPHATFDPVNWVLEGNVIPETMAARILGGNARELFRRL